MNATTARALTSPVDERRQQHRGSDTVYTRGGGRAFVVGTRRAVQRRIGVDTWERIDNDCLPLRVRYPPYQA
ncbi:hypothetical protein JQX13_02080 [Archangium violaceum]|uniref:hypothetical protein n=1 Tax=Archangium violaceum TaxID=83451 RepID=UPI00193C84D0|nr:hypothetical protein [Archangium violaceum]QRK08984.1 hypothetical protein JQX13_02080 [Archangium violaceum]